MNLFTQEEIDVVKEAPVLMRDMLNLIEQLQTKNENFREALIQREMLIECGSMMAGVPTFLESFRDKAKANLRAEGLIE